MSRRVELVILVEPDEDRLASNGLPVDPTAWDRMQATLALQYDAARIRGVRKLRERRWR